LKIVRTLLIPFSVILIIFILTFYLGVAIYIGPQAEMDTKKPADAIVVLGARSYINGKYNPCLKARVDHAVSLYKDKYAPKILMTGGNDREDQVNEAETMRKIAVEQGVPAKAILLEKQASSTYENFIYSIPLLQAAGVRSVIIVTEPFHMARAAAVAEKAGLHATVSPATDSSCWQHGKYISRYFLKEPVAFLLYKLHGKL
jgi:uncharacterized SAM-binding protein YcdF (DUF218 family)